MIFLSDFEGFQFDLDEYCLCWKGCRLKWYELFWFKKLSRTIARDLVYKRLQESIIVKHLLVNEKLPGINYSVASEFGVYVSGRHTMMCISTSVETPFRVST